MSNIKVKLRIFIIIVLLLIVCVVPYLCYKIPTLAIMEIAKQSAIEYISETYPDFVIDIISVEHDWKMNNYIVTYSDAAKNEWTVTFDHTGKKLFDDEYIDATSTMIISDYTRSTESILESRLEESGIPMYYVNINFHNDNEKRRAVVLEGKSVDTIPFSLHVHFVSKTMSKRNFVEKVIKSIGIIKDFFPSQPTSITFEEGNYVKKYRLDLNNDMFSMTPEQLEQFVEG